MLKLRSVFVGVLAISSFCNAASAGIFLSVDFFPGTTAIDSSNVIPVNIGDPITANLVLQLTSPDTLGSYTYSVAYGSDLQLTGRSESAFGSLTPADNSNPTVGNISYRFDGVDFGAGQTTPLGPISIGTVTFTVLGATNTNITPGINEPIFDGFFAADGVTDVTGNVVFNSGNVSVVAVPEPTSMALLACAGGAGWMIRLRRKKRA